MKVTVGNPLRKLVLLKLADNASDQGECWPSVAYIAEQCEISERSVQNHIKQLVADGFIRVEERKSANGLNKTNVYHLSLNSGGANAAPHPAADAPMGAGAAPGGANAAPGEGAGAAPGISHSFEPVKEPVNDPLFDRAWSLYPKRAGANPKARALKAWQARIRAGVRPENMIAGVERYARFVSATNKTGTEFVKQAVSFFGPDRYFDEDWALPAPEGRGTPGAFRPTYSGVNYDEVPEGFRS